MKIKHGCLVYFKVPHATCLSMRQRPMEVAFFMICRIWNGQLFSEAILRKSNDWQGMNIRNRCPVQSNRTTAMLPSTAQQVFPSCQ